MKIIFLTGAISSVTWLIIYVFRSLYPRSKNKQPANINPDKTRHAGPDHYKIIVKEGKQVGVKFDDAGHRKYFFNNN